jgi:hypothetical protein
MSAAMHVQIFGDGFLAVASSLAGMTTPGRQAIQALDPNLGGYLKWLMSFRFSRISCRWLPLLVFLMS